MENLKSQKEQDKIIRKYETLRRCIVYCPNDPLIINEASSYLIKNGYKNILNKTINKNRIKVMGEKKIR
jgi:hypothetical protein